MISDLTSVSTAAHNGRMRAVTEDRHADKSPLELLGWAILEQAVDDLALLCRWGLITPEGKCRPWSRKRKYNGGYYCLVNTPIACMRGPHEHRQLKAWFNSDYAQQFCDLIGCSLNPAEIFATTVKNHSQ